MSPLPPRRRGGRKIVLAGLLPFAENGVLHARLSARACNRLLRVQTGSFPIMSFDDVSSHVRDVFGLAWKGACAGARFLLRPLVSVRSAI
jgi:hypothetical protein